MKEFLCDLSEFVTDRLREELRDFAFLKEDLARKVRWHPRVMAMSETAVRCLTAAQRDPEQRGQIQEIYDQLGPLTRWNGQSDARVLTRHVRTLAWLMKDEFSFERREAMYEAINCLSFALAETEFSEQRPLCEAAMAVLGRLLR